MKNFKKYILASISGIINGLLGTGGGTVALPMLYNVLNDKKEAHKYVSFFVLPMCLISGAIYENKFNVSTLFPVILGGLLGGCLGALLSNRVSLKFIQILFAGIIIYSGVRMLI